MINPLHDADTRRQQRNMTESQRRANISTKEGVLVNSLIKDTDLKDTYTTLLIPNDETLPEKLYENRQPESKDLKPIMALSLGVMSAVSLFSLFVKRNAKIATNLAKEKWIPTVTRNVNLSEETTQAIYQMIQNPSRTTIIAGTGVLALTAMTFIGKTFMDGYKDIWVKRKEADIQKNLQENLISVETQSFSGKMQIIRTMLSKYAQKFDEYLGGRTILPNFGKQNNITFTSEDENKTNFTSNKGKKSALGYIALGLGTIGAIVGLGVFALKNASKSKKFLDQYLNDTRNVIKNITSSTTKETMAEDMTNLENLFKIVDASPEYINSVMKNVAWDETEKTKFIDGIITKIKTSTTKVNPNIGGDGTSKPAFNSFVSDYRAFFYNWLLDTSNPQFKQLFLGVFGVTALGYGGKLVGDAIKDVQVKKINAQTELDLQKRLVSTELRNFKSKKDSAIEPLVDEFYRQVDAGKSKEELKVMAENILFEIKNGAPFVYS